MAGSRLYRYQEQKLTKRLIWALVGTIVLIVCVVVFGLRILIAFSLLVERLKGGTNTPTPTTQTVIILPPTVDPLPDATNSANLIISGKAHSKQEVIIYVNQQETVTLTASQDGTFKSREIQGSQGTNTVSAKSTDGNGHFSDMSNVVQTNVTNKQPTLTLDSPQSDASLNGDSNTVTVSGKTDSDNQVTVNGRFVVVSSSGSFSYTYPLSDGDNTISIIATDQAGNQTKIDRKVHYSK